LPCQPLAESCRLTGPQHGVPANPGSTARWPNYSVTI
jgi:hypothetical protein